MFHSPAFSFQCPARSSGLFASINAFGQVLDLCLRLCYARFNAFQAVVARALFIVRDCFLRGFLGVLFVAQKVVNLLRYPLFQIVLVFARFLAVAFLAFLASVIIVFCAVLARALPSETI